MRGNLRWVSVSAVVALASLSACGDAVSIEQRPEFRENPKPMQAHRLSMRIQNAPGPLRVVVSATQNDVVTPECLPSPNENPGGHLSPIPTHDIPFVLEQVSDTEYAGVFYTDGMVDADYYGLGVCRWRVVQVQVQLKATGADGETRFVASLSNEDIGRGDPKTTYFWKGAYPGELASDIKDFPNFGQADRSRMADSVKDEDVFSVVLQEEEVAR